MRNDEDTTTALTAALTALAAAHISTGILPLIMYLYNNNKIKQNKIVLDITPATAPAHPMSTGILILIMYFYSNKIKYFVLDTTAAPAHPMSTGILIFHSYKIK